jgi:uncharacterized protein YpuA (DUF1002 family)
MMFFLGALFVVLIVGILMLVGALGAAKVDVKLAHKELAECQLVLGRYALLEQQRQKMKEDINVSFTEEQITTLAGRISTRVKTILDNEQQMALNKLS